MTWSRASPRRSQQAYVAHVDASRLTSPSQIFAEFARALHFPQYFGHNWDALNECLADVHLWLTANAVIVLAQDADDLRLNADMPLLLDVLCSGAEGAAATHDDDGEPLARPTLALHFVFLVQPGSLREMQVRTKTLTGSVDRRPGDVQFG